MPDDDTIEFIMLSERNQREIERDNQEQYDWYARPHGRGYKLHRVQKRLDDLLQSMGGMDKGWLRVVWH